MTIAIHQFKLTTEHAASSCGLPVLVGPDGSAYGPADAVEVNGRPVPAASVVETWMMFRVPESERAFAGRFLSQPH